MKLRHFSSEIVTKVHGRRQYDLHHYRNRLWGKPRGFWVSDETRGAYGWRQWTKDERFRPHDFRYEHEVILSPKAKILYLRSVEDIDKFTAEYGFDMMEHLNSHREKPFERNYTRIDAIEWKRVSKKYHGIIITPYQWARRLNGGADWYYPWDCASGCIWNPRAIESITMIKERKVPRKPTSWEERRKHKRWMARMKAMSENLNKELKLRGKTQPVERSDKQSDNAPIVSDDQAKTDAVATIQKDI